MILRHLGEVLKFGDIPISYPVDSRVIFDEILNIGVKGYLLMSGKSSYQKPKIKVSRNSKHGL